MKDSYWLLCSFALSASGDENSTICKFYLQPGHLIRLFDKELNKDHKTIPQYAPS